MFQACRNPTWFHTIEDARRAATPSRKFSEPALHRSAGAAAPAASPLRRISPPALPAIAAELAIRRLTLTGLTLAFGAAITDPWPTVDRFGRRPVLLAGCAAYALTSFAGASVTSVCRAGGFAAARCGDGCAGGGAPAHRCATFTLVEGAKVLSREGSPGWASCSCRRRWSATGGGAVFGTPRSLRSGMRYGGAFAWVWFFFGDPCRPEHRCLMLTLRSAPPRRARRCARAPGLVVLAASYSTPASCLSSGFVYTRCLAFCRSAAVWCLAGNSPWPSRGPTGAGICSKQRTPDRAVSVKSRLDRRWLCWMLAVALVAGAAGAGDDRGSVSDRDRARR